MTIKENLVLLMKYYRNHHYLQGFSIKQRVSLGSTQTSSQGELVDMGHLSTSQPYGAGYTHGCYGLGLFSLNTWPLFPSGIAKFTWICTYD